MVVVFVLNPAVNYRVPEPCAGSSTFKCIEPYGQNVVINWLM